MKENTVSISSLKSGNVIKAGYIRGQRDMTDANRFVGFKVGERGFTNLQDLKEFFGVRNLKELEFEADRQNQFGSVTAEFQNVSDTDCYFWAAYLWNGCFRVGTSADRLQLRAN